MKDLKPVFVIADFYFSLFLFPYFSLSLFPYPAFVTEGNKIKQTIWYLLVA